MDLLTKRQGSNNEDLLKQRFIARILKEESKNISDAQVNLMTTRGFTTDNWYSGRDFSVEDTILRYEHLAKHRFVDMKTRQTKKGNIKKRSHPNHNRIIYAHYNVIAFRLSVEYTERMRTMLAQEYKIHI